MSNDDNCYRAGRSIRHSERTAASLGHLVGPSRRFLLPSKKEIVPRKVRRESAAREKEEGRRERGEKGDEG